MISCCHIIYTTTPWDLSVYHSMHCSSGKKTPIEVQRAGASAKRDSGKLSLLFEQWMSCAGLWAHSEFYIELKKKTTHRQYGSRVWLTRSEMAQKYGSMEVADNIIAAKENDPEIAATQIRLHKDMHGKDTPDSYLTNIVTVAVCSQT